MPEIPPNTYIDEDGRAIFLIPGEHWDEFLAALDRVAEDCPALKKLLTEPTVFDKENDGRNSDQSSDDR